MNSYDNYQQQSFRRLLLEHLRRIEESTDGIDDNTDAISDINLDDLRSGDQRDKTDDRLVNTLRSLQNTINNNTLDLRDILNASSDDTIERDGRIPDIVEGAADRILPTGDNTPPSPPTRDDPDIDDDRADDEEKKKAEKSITQLIKKFGAGMGKAIDSVSGHMKDAFTESTTDAIEREGKIPEIMEWIVDKGKDSSGKLIERTIKKREDKKDREEQDTTSVSDDDIDVIIPVDDTPDIEEPTPEPSTDTDENGTPESKRRRKMKRRNKRRNKKERRRNNTLRTDLMENALVSPVTGATEEIDNQRAPSHRITDNAPSGAERSRIVEQNIRGRESMSIARKSLETFKSMKDGITSLLLVTRLSAAAALLKWALIIGAVATVAGILGKLALDLAEFMGLNKKEEAKDFETKKNAPLTEDNKFDREKMKNESLNERTWQENLSAGAQEVDTDFSPDKLNMYLPQTYITKVGKEIGRMLGGGAVEVGKQNYGLGLEDNKAKEDVIRSKFLDSGAGSWIKKIIGMDTGLNTKYSEIDNDETLTDDEKKTQRILAFLKDQQLGITKVGEDGVKLTGDNVDGIVTLTKEEMSKITNVAQNELESHLKTANDLYINEMKLRDAERRGEKQNEGGNTAINAPVTSITTNTTNVRRDPNPQVKEPRGL